MNRLPAILILFFFISNCAFAQRSSAKELYIDSLKSLIKLSKNDTLRVNALFELEDKICIVDPEASLKAMQDVVVICKEKSQKRITSAEKLFFKIHLGRALNISASYYRTHGDFKTAEKLYLEGLAILQSIKYSKGIASIQNNLSIVYRVKGDFINAIKYATLSLKSFELVKDTVTILRALNNIGIIYIEQSEFEKALTYLNRSLAMSRKIGEKNVEGSTLNNIGTIYLSLNNYNKAINYFSESLKIRQKSGDSFGISNCQVNLGDAYFNLKNYELSNDYFEKALIIKKEIGDVLGTVNCLYRIGEIYNEQKDFKKAIEFGENALLLAKKTEAVVELGNVSRTLYVSYKGLNQYRKALEMDELYIEMRDSINNENSKKEVVRQEFKYAYDKKATADSVRTAEEKKVSSAKLKQEQTQRYALYGFLALTMIFGIFMFNRFRITRKQKYIIEEQKQLVELQKDVVEEKQKEVMDSIHYAKRIQQALLPSNKYIEKTLIRLKR